MLNPDEGRANIYGGVEYRRPGMLAPDFGVLHSVNPARGTAAVRFHLGDTAATTPLEHLTLVVSGIPEEDAVRGNA